MKIAIATCLERPVLTESDAILARALLGGGAEVITAPWNGPFAPFEAADATIVRSTWDYYSVVLAFSDWIGRLASARPIFNAQNVLQWNLGKLYLLELSAAGFAIPATRLVSPDVGSIASAIDGLDLTEAVVKPIFGGTARGLTLVGRGDFGALARAATALGGEEGLVQAYQPDIVAAGETSFVFVDGDYSHSVVKRAKLGDIRVQAEFGGSAAPIDPPVWAVEEAREVLNACPGEPLYARVDAVVRDRELLLMEVELVEPELFFTYCPEAAGRLARALINKLS